MRRRIVFINVVILAGIALSAKHLVSVWESFESTNNIKRIIETVPARQDAEAAESPSPIEQAQLFSDFLVVSDRNLFAPEREPEATGQAAAPKPPALNPKPELNGVTSLGGRRRAFLTVYEGKQKKSKIVEVGDKVKEYMVSTIAKSSLVLSWNDHQVWLDLSSKGAQQAAAAPRSVAAVTVIQVGSAAAAVETTQSEASKAEEKGGLQVAVVGSQAGLRAGANQRGLAQGGVGAGGGRGGQGIGRGRGRGAQSGVGAGGRRGLPSTVGIPGAGVGVQSGTPSRRQRTR